MIFVVSTAISIRVCSRIHVLAALPLASLDVKGSLTLSTLPSELCVCVLKAPGKFDHLEKYKILMIKLSATLHLTGSLKRGKFCCLLFSN